MFINGVYSPNNPVHKIVHIISHVLWRIIHTHRTHTPGFVVCFVSITIEVSINTKPGAGQFSLSLCVCVCVCVSQLSL